MPRKPKKQTMAEMKYEAQQIQLETLRRLDEKMPRIMAHLDRMFPEPVEVPEGERLDDLPALDPATIPPPRGVFSLPAFVDASRPQAVQAYLQAAESALRLVDSSSPVLSTAARNALAVLSSDAVERAVRLMDEAMSLQRPPAPPPPEPQDPPPVEVTSDIPGASALRYRVEPKGRAWCKALGSQGYDAPDQIVKILRTDIAPANENETVHLADVAVRVNARSGILPADKPVILWNDDLWVNNNGPVAVDVTFHYVPTTKDEAEAAAAAEGE